MAEEKALPWKKVYYNLTLMLAAGVILMFALYLLPTVQQRHQTYAEQEAAVSVSPDSPSGQELPALTVFVFGISDVVWMILAGAVMIGAFGELFVARKMGKRWILVPLFAVALGALALQGLALVLSSMKYL